MGSDEALTTRSRSPYGVYSLFGHPLEKGDELANPVGVLRVLSVSKNLSPYGPGSSVSRALQWS